MTSVLTYKFIQKSIAVGVMAVAMLLGMMAFTATAQARSVEYHPDSVVLYEHENYGGYAVHLGVGRYTLSNLELLGMRNDDITSLRIADGYQATLYWDENFGGNSRVETEDVKNLESIWNDQLSSVVVTRISDPTIELPPPPDPDNITALQEQINQLLLLIEKLQDQLNGGGKDIVRDFTEGDKVNTTDALSVRATPGGRLLRIVPVDSVGQIVDGPTTLDGRTWWKVKYGIYSPTAEVSGWSAGNWLELAGPRDPEPIGKFGLKDIDYVTAEAVDPLPQAVDDEYTMYTIFRKNGTSVEVHGCSGYCPSRHEVLAKAFRDAGYTGDVDELLKLVRDVPPEDPVTKKVTVTGVLEIGDDGSSAECIMLRTEEGVKYSLSTKKQFALGTRVTVTGNTGDIYNDCMLGTSIHVESITSAKPTELADDLLTAEVTSGDAPLFVFFKVNWMNRTSGATIEFDDGSGEKANQCFAPNDDCLTPGTNAHLFMKDGTYNVRLVRDKDELLLDRVTITVGDPVGQVEGASISIYDLQMGALLDAVQKLINLIR